MTDALVPGGLDSFQEKIHWRQRAIDCIGEDCLRSKRVRIVMRHYVFWIENEPAGQAVLTDNDLKTYTHVLYLDTPPPLVMERRPGGFSSTRPKLSTTITPVATD